MIATNDAGGDHVVEVQETMWWRYRRRPCGGGTGGDHVVEVQEEAMWWRYRRRPCGGGTGGDHVVEVQEETMWWRYRRRPCGGGTGGDHVVEVQEETMWWRYRRRPCGGGTTQTAEGGFVCAALWAHLQADGPVACLLRGGACRPALEEVPLLGAPQHVGLVNAYVLWTMCNRPLPANKRLYSLKAFKLALIPNFTDDYVSGRVVRLPPAIDVPAAMRMIAEDTVEGRRGHGRGSSPRAVRWPQACVPVLRQAAQVDDSWTLCRNEFRLLGLRCLFMPSRAMFYGIPRIMQLCNIINTGIATYQFGFTYYYIINKIVKKTYFYIYLFSITACGA